jgi:predicted phage tail component-like protein
MTISQCLYFTYDNVNFYEQFGIINVNIDSGLYDESFIANRNLMEQKIRGNPIPYFQEIKDEPLEFKLSFAFSDSFDDDKIRSVARSLKKDYYAPLVFSDNPERIFYAICVDNPRLIHTGSGTGNITLNFRCNSPYAYSSVYTSSIYDTDTTADSSFFATLFLTPTFSPLGVTNITLVNNGDLSMRPIIYAKLLASDTFSIINLSNGGQQISFSGIAIGETITIDCQNEEIESDISTTTYRINNMTGEFLEIIRGNNILQVIGNIQLQFKYEYAFL